MKKTLLKIAISGLLFFLLSRLVDLSQLRETISQVDLLFFALGCLIIILNYVVGAVRWEVLIGEDSPKVLYLLKLYFLGAFFNNFMPSSVGGDAYKMYRLGKDLKDAVRGVATTFMDRFVGIMALFCLSSFGLISFWGLKGLGALALFVAGVIFGLWFLRSASSWHPVIEKFQKIIYSYKDKRKVLIKAFLLSFGVQFCSVGAELCAFYSLGLRPPLGQSVFFLPLINFVAFLPISFNGLGVQDGLFIFAFSKVGMAREGALSASVTYHFMRLVVSLIGGLLYAVESFRSPKEESSALDSQELNSKTPPELSP